MSDHTYAVILTGGINTHLWPKRNQLIPKQFHIFRDNRSLVQETFDRIATTFPLDRIYVTTNDLFLKEVLKQLPGISKDNIIMEPIGRSTTATTAVIAAVIAQRDPEGIVVELPSDHLVQDRAGFLQALEDAVTIISGDRETITTIGIPPRHAHTGLGYIKQGKPQKAPPSSHYQAYAVEKFIEKPDYETAQRFVQEGTYLWNTGYFIWHAKTMKRIITHYAPDIAKKVARFMQAKTKAEKRAIYDTIEPISVDYSVMEAYPKLMVIPADLGWSDVGNWSTYHDIQKRGPRKEKLTAGTTPGSEDENVLILGHNKLIATAGLKDIIVVDTPDVLLICHKDKTGDIKSILEYLSEQGLDDISETQ